MQNQLHNSIILVQAYASDLFSLTLAHETSAVRVNVNVILTAICQSNCHFLYVSAIVRCKDEIKCIYIYIYYF